MNFNINASFSLTNKENPKKVVVKSVLDREDYIYKTKYNSGRYKKEETEDKKKEENIEVRVKDVSNLQNNFRNIMNNKQ